jgi:DNA-binding Lrp family transcriptional regulator
MPSAYVLINCDLGYEDQIINELEKLTGVDYATGLDGAYDIIAKVNAESTEKLKEIIMLHVKKIDKIQSMTTLIVIED